QSDVLAGLGGERLLQGRADTRLHLGAREIVLDGDDQDAVVQRERFGRVGEDLRPGRETGDRVAPDGVQIQVIHVAHRTSLPSHLSAGRSRVRVTTETGRAAVDVVHTVFHTLCTKKR